MMPVQSGGDSASLDESSCGRSLQMSVGRSVGGSVGWLFCWSVGGLVGWSLSQSNLLSRKAAFDHGCKGNFGKACNKKYHWHLVNLGSDPKRHETLIKRMPVQLGGDSAFLDKSSCGRSLRMWVSWSVGWLVGHSVGQSLVGWLVVRRST